MNYRISPVTILSLLANLLSTLTTITVSIHRTRLIHLKSKSILFIIYWKCRILIPYLYHVQVQDCFVYFFNILQLFFSGFTVARFNSTTHNANVNNRISVFWTGFEAEDSKARLFKLVGLLGILALTTSRSYWTLEYSHSMGRKLKSSPL